MVNENEDNSTEISSPKARGTVSKVIVTDGSNKSLKNNLNLSAKSPRNLSNSDNLSINDGDGGL